MLRRWVPQIALTVCFAAGAVGWGSLSLRGANEWVFHITKGMWFDDMGDITPRDVAIVPGVLFRSGRPQAFLEERLGMALGLYRSGRVKAILVSGDEQRAGNEASGMRRWLLDRGVPSTAVLADPLGTRTLVTMTRAAHVFGVRSAIICTQGMHAPRSVFLARGAGIDAVALVPHAPRNGYASRRAESLKVSLAFIEHYLLRQTQSAPSTVPRVELAELLR
jgi:SanA protein